jgi:hypothetical protein
MRCGLFTAVLLIFASTGCLGPDTAEAALGEEFELAPNQSTRIAGTQLVVGFRRVAGDSRCPIDTACVVEGNAGIELELFGGAASGPVVVNTPLPNTWDDGTYQLTLLELEPHPTASRAISPDEYRLRMMVDLLPR